MTNCRSGILAGITAFIFYLLWSGFAHSAPSASESYQRGYKFEQGEDVRQDYGRAAEAYREAAAQGHARAQNALALLYLKGQGVPADPEQAFELYHQAAEQGLPAAQFNLARLYSKGEGVAAEADKAAYWYQQSAAQGHVGAMKALGALYNSDQLGKPDYVLSYAWYQIAVEYGAWVSEGVVALLETKMRPRDMQRAEELIKELHPDKPRG